MSKIVRFVLLAALLASSASGSAKAAELRPEGVQPWVWEHTEGGASAEMLVVMEASADLTPAANLNGKAARGAWVVAELRHVAESSQAPLRAWLKAAEIRYSAFHVANVLLVRGDRALAVALAARGDVSRVAGNPRIRNDLPSLGDGEVDADGGVDAKALLGIEWGIDRIGAPELWAQGFEGQGIVVGGQDTGVRWTHQSVQGHYRGWDGATASHDYNWHDSIHDANPDNDCGSDSPEPCDDSSHGTHTVGTAVGGDGADNEIGVAHGAKWIGCRNMDDSVGTPATYLECFEFFLAPYPVGGDPSQGLPGMAPDVTINSWRCPASEGCDWDVLESAVDAQAAAGIMTVVSAGNAGSSCGSVRSPPAIYGSAYGVGATNSSDRLAGFSSRGPSRDTDLMKPDIVAPGVSVRSATAGADDSYEAFRGTSMAGPHVSGAVALLWSAEPSLRNDIARTEELFNRTAIPLRWQQESCGGDYDFGPNNSWGHGLINVARALEFAFAPPVEMVCDDGVDDDGDGWIDCADPECAGAPNCPETGNCSDRVDNDLDGIADCADTDCIADPACPEFGNCSDGLDNDVDGAVDCEDRDCDVDRDCPGLAINRQIVIGPTGVEPWLSDQFASGCRYPAWRLCPDEISPGPLDGRLLQGEAAPTGLRALWLYQHSAGRGDLLFFKDGADLGFAAP